MTMSSSGLSAFFASTFSRCFKPLDLPDCLQALPLHQGGFVEPFFVISLVFGVRLFQRLVMAHLPGIRQDVPPAEFEKIIQLSPASPACASGSGSGPEARQSPGTG